MRDIAKITINLTIVCIIAGFILTGTFATTEPVKLYKEALEKEEALRRILPEAEKIEKEGKIIIHEKEKDYYVCKIGDEKIGYIAEAIGKGYSSFIKMLVAVDLDYKIKGIDILGHGETPGLGDEIEKKEFKDQFKGKTIEKLVVIKGFTEDKIQAISGATISSRAVTEGVKEAIKRLRERLEQKKV
ncbi:MAG: RnfABCDGE type electron transport complex subunit G [Nitrospirota bacterium]